MVQKVPAVMALTQFPAVNAIVRTQHDDNADFLSVKAFGAIGDGINDDTAGLIAAEVAAFARGMNLIMPPGRYRVSGAWPLRVSLSAYGATLQQITLAVVFNLPGPVAHADSNSPPLAPVPRAPVSACVLSIRANDLTVEGLTVDADLKSTGIFSDGFSRLTLRDCRSNNALNMAFGFYYGTDVLCINCRASNIRYGTLPGTVGGAADGFYFAACDRSGAYLCRADDYRRIGFVAEGESASKSNQITFAHCVASNGNNCDHSTTEYNAGFWIENTNSADLLQCIAYNNAGNAGQASGRVTGIVLCGGGNNSHGLFTMTGCRIFGGGGYMPVGVTIGGSATWADVVMSSNYVGKARIAVGVLCNLQSLKIKDLSLEDIVTTGGSQGGVMIDAAGTGSLPLLEIDNIIAKNCVWHGDTGAVNFFSTPTGCVYSLRRFRNMPHVMRGFGNRVRTEECHVVCGTTSVYPAFAASFCEFIDSIFTSRNNSNADYIINGAALPVGSVVTFRGGWISGASAGGWNMEFGGDSNELHVHGVRISNFCFSISVTNTSRQRFYENQFLAVPPVTGCIRVNYNAPAKQVLIVQNNYFESAAAADTPIRLWLSAPTNTILQGNVRKTATVLTNIGGAVDTNGVLV